MSLDYSAVPRMPDGRTALETIESVAAKSRAVKVPMGPSSAGGGGQQMWHIWGEGSGKPALLLFHGGSGSWIHWIRNVLPLSRHFTVYAADAPGLGDSDPPNDVKDIWSVTDCVEHAVKELLPKDRQFFLTGFSFGGMVSGHLATRMPERIKRIVFVGAGGLKATRKPTGKLHKLLPTMAPQLLADEARRNLELLMLHDAPARIGKREGDRAPCEKRRQDRGKKPIALGKLVRSTLLNELAAAPWGGASPHA